MALKSAVGYLPKSAKEMIKRHAAEFLQGMSVYDGSDDITPPLEKVMRAFVGWDNVRVVIFGQDPYPKKSIACGLAFGTELGVAVPDSIKNIYACLLRSGLITSIPDHADLTSWAEQGVLLLNTSLTTVVGKPAAHVQYWNPFVTRVIEELDRPGMIFIMLGGHARKLASKHATRLEWGHPSPINTINSTDKPGAFKFCTCFASANQILEEAGEDTINWDSVNKQ